MRVKKYKRELELYEKKKNENPSYSEDQESIATLENLLKEKEAMIDKLNKENQVIMNIYEDTETELRKLSHQLSKQQKELNDLKHDMLTLRDELFNNPNIQIRSIYDNMKQQNTESNDLMALKQQLTKIQSLITNQNPVPTPSINVPREPRKTGFTFRDLQKAGRVYSTTNITGKGSFLSGSPSPMNHKVNNLNVNENKVISSLNNETFTTETTPDVKINKLELELQPSFQEVQKENTMLSAFSFLKKKT